MWSDLKERLSSWISLSHDALHIHVGLVLFVLLAYLLRRYRWGPLGALGAVLALELANEISDSFDWVRWTGAPNFAESARDITDTMFWPMILAIIIARLGRPRPR